MKFSLDCKVTIDTERNQNHKHLDLVSKWVRLYHKWMNGQDGEESPRIVVETITVRRGILECPYANNPKQNMPFTITGS